MRRPPLAPGRIRCALRLPFARCAVWSWGAQPDCGLCVAGLVQPPGGRYGQPVVKTHRWGLRNLRNLTGAVNSMGRTSLTRFYGHSCPWLDAARHLGLSCYCRGYTKHRSRNRLANRTAAWVPMVCVSCRSTGNLCCGLYNNLFLFQVLLLAALLSCSQYP